MAEIISFFTPTSKKNAFPNEHVNGNQRYNQPNTTCTYQLHTWDGNDVRSLCVQPGEGQLPHRAPLAVRQRLHAVHQRQVALQVALGEFGVDLAVVVLAQRGGVQGADGAGQEAAAEGRVGNDLDAYAIQTNRRQRECFKKRSFAEWGMESALTKRVEHAGSPQYCALAITLTYILYQHT